MATTPTPTRKTSEQELDQWNKALRASPEYAEYMQMIGVDPTRPIKLSEQQQNQFEQFLASKGIQVPEGMHIDPAGNLNQKNRLWKNVAKYGAYGAAAATGLGAAGIGPLAGIMGTAGAGGAAGATTMVAPGIPAVAGTGAGLSVPGLAAGVSGVIPGTGIPAVGGAGGAAAGAAAPTAGAASGFGRLAGLLKNGSAVEDIGRAVGAAGDTAAQNRGQELSADESAATIDAHNLDTWRNAVLAREAEGRAGTNDARRNLQYGEYLKGGGSTYQPKSGLSSYGFGPKGATEAEMAGGASLSNSAGQRLANGNPVPEFERPAPFTSTARTPGKFEKIANYASPAASVWGAIRRWI